jgi:hypothetical protein
MKNKIIEILESNFKQKQWIYMNEIKLKTLTGAKDADIEHLRDDNIIVIREGMKGNLIALKSHEERLAKM